MNGRLGTPGPLGDAVFTFSQSSLQDYSDCPRRFELRYIQDALWPAVEAEPLSQVEDHRRQALLFHRLVQQHYLGMTRESLAAMAAAPDLARWWKNFSTAAPDLAGWTLHTEKALMCPIGSHRLVCHYDLLAVRDGKALIYDWKTFARRPKNEWLAARMQTKTYRTVLAQAGAELNSGRPFEPADISMIYWFAEFPEDPASFAFDKPQYLRDWQSLEGLVRDIAHAATFPLAQDTLQCRFCTYRSLCDRGRLPGTDPHYDLKTGTDDSPAGDFEPVGENQS
jgi:hypothetical protein